MIYIYRTPEFAGEALSYDVKAHDKVVTTLRNGGYYPYVVRPGLVELSSAAGFYWDPFPEIAENASQGRVLPAQTRAPRVSCAIGEQMWRERWGN